MKITNPNIKELQKIYFFPMLKCEWDPDCFDFWASAE